MTSRYRVEYHLKSHRRDELIEWIKGLLVVPFVLVRELPSASKPHRHHSHEHSVRQRYASVFADVEALIEDHSMLSFNGGLTSVFSCTSEWRKSVTVKVEDACSYNWNLFHAVTFKTGVSHYGSPTCYIAATFRGS